MADKKIIDADYEVIDPGPQADEYRSPLTHEQRDAVVEALERSWWRVDVVYLVGIIGTMIGLAFLARWLRPIVQQASGWLIWVFLAFGFGVVALNWYNDRRR